MSTEELTAEDLYTLACVTADGGHGLRVEAAVAKLLRVYSAALARAEAAEQVQEEQAACIYLETKRSLDAENRVVAAEAIARTHDEAWLAAEAAESRLAAATALLRECAGALAGNAYRAQLNPEVVRFLSVTPTQAAEPE